MDEDAFTLAAEELGMSNKTSKFMADEMVAMCDEANVGTKATRVLRSWFSLKGMKSMFPLETKICKMGDGAVIATTVAKKVDGKKCLYMFYPIDQLIKQMIIDNYENNLQSFKIHVGGDHGKGAFHVPVKLVLKYADKVETVQ